MGPNDLRFHILRSSDLFVSYPYNITVFDLGELEDLYYATCAKLKELIQGADILLTNGFKGVHDTYFTYCNEPLSSLGPISIGSFRSSLLIHERILYSDELQSLLNRGVTEKNSGGSKHTHHQQMSPGSHITQHDVEHCNCQGTEEYIDNPRYDSKQISRCRVEAEGLQNKSNMSCGMVFGELAEKYRPMVMNAELKGLMIDRKSTPEAPQAYREEVSTRKYISPYNLDERAKKLNVPGGPEMPCICDPECICAPLCASDPTQNCLCEENGLFVRVTEGMDIDDLDVPDLVRRERRFFEASEISTTSLSSTDGSSSQWALSPAGSFEAATSSDNTYRVTNDFEKNTREHEKKASDKFASPGPMSTTAGHLDRGLSMSGIFELTEQNDGLSWQERLNIPPPRMSDFTQYELLQPFAKQCDHPPKRQSVAERFFKTKTNSMAAHKKDLSMDQPTQGHNINGNTSKVVKQANKRSLGDMSFTGLRLSLRRGQRGR